MRESFTCAFCAGVFNDGPPLVIVTGGDVADEEYCSDDCAFSAGWARAVEARWRAEARDGETSVVYTRPRYLQRLAIS
jgi:hypothetical protein